MPQANTKGSLAVSFSLVKFFIGREAPSRRCCGDLSGCTVEGRGRQNTSEGLRRCRMDGHRRACALPLPFDAPDLC